MKAKFWIRHTVLIQICAWVNEPVSIVVNILCNAFLIWGLTYSSVKHFSLIAKTEQVIIKLVTYINKCKRRSGYYTISVKKEKFWVFQKWLYQEPNLRVVRLVVKHISKIISWKLWMRTNPGTKRLSSDSNF